MIVLSLPTCTYLSLSFIPKAHPAQLSKCHRTWPRYGLCYVSKLPVSTVSCSCFDLSTHHHSIYASFTHTKGSCVIILLSNNAYKGKSLEMRLNICCSGWLLARLVPIFHNTINIPINRNQSKGTWKETSIWIWWINYLKSFLEEYSAKIMFTSELLLTGKTTYSAWLRKTSQWNKRYYF